MPWYNVLQKSMHDLFISSPKQAEPSSYLSAIQALKESTPGRKHAELNGRIRRLVGEARDKHELGEAREYRDIPAGLAALVRVELGVELRLREPVIEGLKSEDRELVGRALRARWFFDNAAEHVQADRFAEIMPRLSLRVRRAVIGRLSHSLIGHEVKAERFFQVFLDLYGAETSLPILTACSDGFIYENILSHRIVLPQKVVDSLYKRRPEVVVKYLQLANDRNAKNAEERKLLQVRINDYDVFIPKLIKKHPGDFAELYELTPDKDMILSNTKAASFLRNLQDVLLEKPQIFLKLLPLQMVSQSLSKDEFDNMFKKLFPTNIDDIDINEMLTYLEHYSHGDKIQVLKDKYKEVYSIDFPADKYLMQSKKLRQILPNDEKKNIVKLLLEKHKDNPDMVQKIRGYLPPEELVPLLKNELKHMNNGFQRAKVFVQMIKACRYYHNTKYLLEVLEFYCKVHKNEIGNVLSIVLSGVEDNFEQNSLDENHWNVLIQIIKHVHAKKLLVSVTSSVTHWVIEGALYCYLTNNKSDLANELFNILIFCKIELGMHSWNIFTDNPDLERKCMEKFFELTPIKYPSNHTVWQDKNNQLLIALNVVDAIVNYNERNFPSSKRAKKNFKKRNVTAGKKLQIVDYPWIKNLVEVFLQDDQLGFRKKKLQESIEKNFPEFYVSKVNSDEIQDINSGKALTLLRRDPKKVLANWEKYLQQAASKLHNGSKAAKRFVSATKWYKDIPIKFAEQSILRMQDPGYIEMLGILLEGQVVEKLASALVPDATINANDSEAQKKFTHTESILKAMRFTNPPVDLDILIPFCHPDYINLTEPTLLNLAYRIPVNRVLEFAEKLTNLPKITVKKQGFRLYRKAATIGQLTEFLTKHASASNSSVRLLVAKMIFDVFVEVPNQRTWILVKNFINSITVNDKDIIENVFWKIHKIDRHFLSDYISVYFDKIDRLSIDESLSDHLKARCFEFVISLFNENWVSFLSEEFTAKIFQKHCFNMDFYKTSKVVQKFVVRIYLINSKEKEEAFKAKLASVMNALKHVSEQYDKPHQKISRLYPANFMIMEFFDELVMSVRRSDCDRKLQIIEESLNFFNTTLKPVQDPFSYLTLSFFKEDILSDTLHDFGVRCVRLTHRLVEEFSAVIIHDIVEIINTQIQERIEGCTSKYTISVIEGMLSEDDYYGCLLAAHMLNYDDVIHISGSGYDKIIEVLRQKKDKSIQFILNKHINFVDYYSD